VSEDATPDLPPAAAILRYLRLSPGWAEGTQGSHGCLFTRDGFEIAVPHEDEDRAGVLKALVRLAEAEGRWVTEVAGAVLAGGYGQPEPRAGGDSREQLGRLVHETRLAREAERAAAEGRVRFLLGSWEERSDDQRELDMRIGEAVAAVERERIARQVEDVAANYPEDVFPPDSGSRDAISGTAMRHAYRNAARAIREEAVR